MRRNEIQKVLVWINFVKGAPVHEDNASLVKKIYEQAKTGTAEMTIETSDMGTVREAVHMLYKGDARLGSVGLQSNGVEIGVLDCEGALTMDWERILS